MAIVMNKHKHPFTPDGITFVLFYQILSKNTLLNTRDHVARNMVFRTGFLIQISFQYADDIALNYQSIFFSECEANLPWIETLAKFRQDRNMRLLNIYFADTQIQHVDYPKHLGVTLDRSLTYNTHSGEPALILLRWL
jgi:hypothetical protein